VDLYKKGAEIILDSKISNSGEEYYKIIISLRESL